VKTLFLWFLLASHALAAEVVLQADSARLQAGQTVGVHVTVVDGRVTDQPALNLPSGLSAVYRGQRQSMVMGTGGSSRTVTYSWAVTSLEPGEHRIGPVRVRTKKRILESNSLTLFVKAREAKPGGEGVSSSLGDGVLWNGQTVVYRVVFRTPRQLLNVRWSPPELEGFAPEPSVDAAEHSYIMSDEGRNWTVVEVDTPFVATGVGARSLAGGLLYAQFPGGGRNGFRLLAQTREETFVSQKLDVQVRPLPTEGRPEDFSGLVGSFELSAELSAAEITLGESATLEITLSGNGSLAGFRLPGLEDSREFRAYDDEPEVQSALVEGDFVARGTFRRALVPESDGRLEVPPLSIVVFNPESERYERLETPKMVLGVMPGEGGARLSSYSGETGKGAVDALAEDILPIHPRARLRSQVFEPTKAVGLGLFPWVGLWAWWFFDALRRRRPSPQRALRAELAQVTSGDLAALEQVFRDALGLVVGLGGAGVEARILEERLPESLRDEALEIYRDIERARYGAAKLGDLDARVRNMVRRLLEVCP